MDEMVIITMERFEKMKVENERKETAANSCRFETSRLVEDLTNAHQELRDLNEETRRLRWFKNEIMACYDWDGEKPQIICAEGIYETVYKAYKEGDEK